MLPVAASLLELALEGVDAVVDGLFKGVGHLVGKQVLVAGHKQLDRCLLVHSGFRFHDFEDHLSLGDLLVVLCQFLYLLVDKVV